MSELMNAQTGNGDFRPHLLASVSATVLLVAVTAAPSVKAREDADRPTVWIELGGQLENVSGSDGRFVSPIMLADPQPTVIGPVAPINVQRPPRYAVGEEGRLSFQPQNSGFVFSASLRYGRSTGHKHAHNQSIATLPTYPPSKAGLNFPPHAAMYADAKSRHDESHLVLDFQVGKDVGLGLFGKDGAGTINAGVRIAQLVSHSTATFSARPSVTFYKSKKDLSRYGLGTKYYIRTSFYQNLLKGHADRSFHGIGPSLSLDASVPIAGEQESVGLALDWGIDGAVLFGRQKANIVHNTAAYHMTTKAVYHPVYQAGNPRNQSRSIIVPNVGGFAALTFKFPNSKVSFGYRGDFFFGAMDTGIDVANRTTVGFHGPYATISIGLGG